ncbi:MAG: hypothetical protein PHS53_05250, partial [Candidatus Pacebacteria bacterium]|nr:hypothetical protein [Candidatus Paceibacterota bacterium]
MQNSLLKTVLIGVLVFLVALAIGYFAGGYGAFHIQRSEPSLEPMPVTTATTTDTTKVAGFISWNEKKEVSVPNIFLSPPPSSFSAPSNIHAYQVGTVTDGPYKGGTLLLVQYSQEGELGGSNSFEHFIQLGSKLILLGKHSQALYDGDGLDHAKFTVDPAYEIPELIAPKEIHYGKAVLRSMSSDFGDELFDGTNLIPIFFDSVVGQVFTDKTNGKNGFYYKAPDGTKRDYDLVIDFMNKEGVPDIEWTGGEKNTTSYIWTDRGGCGRTNYISIVSGILPSDLLLAGATNHGDKVYVLKDINYPILHNIYDQFRGILSYDSNGNPVQISYNDFVNSRPA